MSLPGHAAEGATFADPAGDASELPVAVAPLADPALDLLKVTISSDGKAVFFTAHVTAVGMPRTGNGQHVGFRFEYMEHPFDISLVDDATGYRAASLRDTDTSPPTNLACGLCLATFDKKTNTVTYKAPIASLSAGMRKADAKLKPFEKGARLTTLSAVTAAARGFGRDGVGHGYTTTPYADTATAPEKLVFTL